MTANHLYLTICSDTSTSAKEVVAALLKRLSHRNPNVQIFTLEVSKRGCWLYRLPCASHQLSTPSHHQLANSLVQNNGKTTHAEISSRAWTGALDRLVTDRVSFHLQHLHLFHTLTRPLP